MAFSTGGIGHVAIRVTDLERARAFYVGTLGFEPVHEAEGLVLVDVNGVGLGIFGNARRTRKNDRFNPFRVGLDHIALRVNAADLDSLKAQLDTAGVPNNGIEDDEVLGGRYISFQDPDGIAWELYAMPSAE